MKPHFAPIALPAILALAVAGCGSASSGASPSATALVTPVPTVKIPPTPVVTGGDTAAIVNGNKIPMQNFRLLLGLAFRQEAGRPGVTTKLLASQAMNQLVNDELVREYAVSHGLTATNAEVNAQIKADEKRFGGEAGLKQKLAQIGLTLAGYTIFVRASVQRHKVASAVTPLMAAHVRHILIATAAHKPKRTDAQALALARRLLSRIQHSADFAALARQYSDDTSSGKQGGDLGTFCTGVGVMVPPFDRASATLPPMHPAIVHSQYGYHIVEVLSRGRAKPGQCTQPGAPAGSPALTADQSPAFQSWVNQLARHATIRRLAHVS